MCGLDLALGCVATDLVWRLGVWQRIWFGAGVCGNWFSLADSMYLSQLVREGRGGGFPNVKPSIN